MKCCKKGHVATTGWDAASGLGTLRFSTLLSDLPGCLARMKSSNDFATTEQLSAMLLDEQELEEDSDNHVKSWTPVEQRATQFLGVVSLICAVSLIAYCSSTDDSFWTRAIREQAQGDMGLVPRATPPANTYFLINQAKTRTD
ncbi:Peptidase S8/S53 domain [Phytophthora cactorum]|nr:Peptidase S8/S53 domain [Phytophthora cactorum]